MLQRWFRRTRPTGAGACSIVAVDAHRSTASQPIIAVNVDEPLLAVPRSAASTTSDGVETLAVSEHVFLGRNALGLTVAVVVRNQHRRRTALRLGRMMLGCCRYANQIGDVVRQFWCGSATVVTADALQVRGWNVVGGATRLLTAPSGLLVVSAGHANDAPLPGGGWLIEKLLRLEPLTRISPDDVQRSLAASRLGSGTTSIVVVEPTAGADRFFRGGGFKTDRQSA